MIGELDATFHKHHGVRIVAKDWKTHARPAGGNAQTNINNQVGPGDIFVGLLWTRLGMDAGRRRTGFEQEYAVAKKQWRRRKSSLMLYLRTSSPRKLDAVDPAKLQAVRDFIARIQKKYEALYWTYGALRDFEKLLRRHLTDELHARLKLAASPKGTSQPVAAPATKAPKRKKPRKLTPRQFALKGFRSVRSRFERRAKAETKMRPHITVTLNRKGENALVAVVSSYGSVRARACISAAKGEGQWGLVYERGDSHPFYGSEPTFRPELRVQVADHDGVRGFARTSRQRWDVKPGVDQSAEVAEAFWDRLMHGVS